MDIGRTIRNLRKAKQLSQMDFIKKVGISQTSLSQIESGRKRPNRSNLKKICKALGVTELHLYLLSFDESDVPSSKRDLYKKIEQPLRQLVESLI